MMVRKPAAGAGGKTTRSKSDAVSNTCISSSVAAVVPSAMEHVVRLGTDFSVNNDHDCYPRCLLMIRVARALGVGAAVFVLVLAPWAGAQRGRTTPSYFVDDDAPLFTPPPVAPALAQAVA